MRHCEAVVLLRAGRVGLLVLERAVVLAQLLAVLRTEGVREHAQPQSCCDCDNITDHLLN